MPAAFGCHAEKLRFLDNYGFHQKIKRLTSLLLVEKDEILQ